jgi:ABC-type transport system involved in multi-copper enzyme maturation permease subunit
MIRPIFALFIRSLREDTRAKFTPIMRASLVLVILFFIAVNQRDFARQNAPGLQVFFIVMLVNLAGLVLGGLTAFCSAITEEKEDETLGLLRMTNLNSVSILFGKSLSRFVSAAFLIVAQIPFTMLCVTLGGVSAITILKGYEILLCTLFLLCNLGLLMSVIARKTAMAVALSLFVGVIWYAALPFYFAITLRVATMPSGLLHEVSGHAIVLNPIMQLGTLVFGNPGGGFPKTLPDPLLFHAIAGTVCFLLAWALFGKFCSGTQETAPRKKKATPGEKKLRIPRPGVLAIAWKDFWFLGGGRRGLILRYIAYALLIFGIVGAFLAEKSRLQSDDIGEMFMVFSLIGLGVEIILASARIFGSERKALTLSSLLTLPLPLGEIVRQKILGMLPPFIPALTFFAVGAVIAPSSVEDFFRDLTRGREFDTAMYFYLGMHIVLLPLLVCWMSLKIRRGGVAAALSIVFVWDVLGAVLGDEMRSETGFAWLGVLSFVVFSIVLAFKIARELPRAGAVD